MKSFAVLATLAAAITPAFSAIIPRQSGKLKPVSLKGNAFFVEDKRFYVRGVAYQPGGAADAQDPLLDIPSLKRDIANFKKLGINTIRIYTIDNSENHDEGMKMLDEAGIYLALDANTPKYSLNRENAATLHRSYNDEYLRSVFATVDAFAGYNNLLLFFSGNEVINAKNNTNAAPYIKAVTRDMKQYISQRASRPIPVGYSAADVAENINQQALYFDCGSDDVRADFFAFNDYSWCDPSSFTESGWDKKVELYKDYPVPIFLSEFGCITNEREWNEIAALYSTKMSAVYSGGLVYEYTVEPNGFGLVEVVNGKVETNKDFDRLVDAYKKQKDPQGDGNFKENGVASQCPPADPEWEVENNEIPAIPDAAKAYFSDGAGDGPGLSGTGSHFAGETSTSTATPGAGPSSTSGSQNSTGGGDEGAAPSVPVPIYFMGMIAASVVFGAALII